MKANMIKKIISFAGIFLNAVLLVSCAGPQNPQNGGTAKNIVDFSFSHTGSTRAEIYSYKVSKTDSDILVHIEYGAGYLVIDETGGVSMLNALNAIVIQNKIAEWNGFDEAGHSPLDGSGFDLLLTLSDGSEITARGNNRFPPAYDEFEKDVNDVFAPFIQKAQADSSKGEMPGGRDEYADPGAALNIISKDIVNFECRFDCSNFYLSDEKRNYPYFYCVFSLERKGDSALCKTQTVSNLDFETPLSALDDLQALIDEYDLVKYNGIFNHTSGLPEGYGVFFSVEYASGEKLSFKDNQHVMIGDKATMALHDFFQDLTEDAGHRFYAEEEME